LILLDTNLSYNAIIMNIKHRKRLHL
jgi:hypothetical protein